MARIYTILFGLCIASFIGSLSYRVPRGISIVRPRSFCPHCFHTLGLADLIPVVSYLLLRGRCRHCNMKIPPRYFLVELALPLLFLLLFQRIGFTYRFFLLSYLISVMLYLSLLDIDTGHVSAWDIAAVYIGSLVLLFFSLTNRVPYRATYYLFGSLVGAGLVGVSFTVVLLLKRRIPMGAGDLLVIPALGFYFGAREIVRVLIFGSALGVAVGVVLMAVGAVKRDQKFPLLPYLAAGVVFELLLFS
ncbi:MAG TPA: prepilin peptidase [Spirochaetota bacterium]|nr:prepilin peptidase [Spirochaetota bacterium]